MAFRLACRRGECESAVCQSDTCDACEAVVVVSVFSLSFVTSFVFVVVDAASLEGGAAVVLDGGEPSSISCGFTTTAVTVKVAASRGPGEERPAAACCFCASAAS